jgi:hypothetical protein
MVRGAFRQKHGPGGLLHTAFFRGIVLGVTISFLSVWTAHGQQVSPEVPARKASDPTILPLESGPRRALDREVPDIPAFPLEATGGVILGSPDSEKELFSPEHPVNVGPI